MKPYGMKKRDFTKKSAVKARHRNGYDDMVVEDPPKNREKLFAVIEILDQLVEVIDAVVD